MASSPLHLPGIEFIVVAGNAVADRSRATGFLQTESQSGRATIRHGVGILLPRRELADMILEIRRYYGLIVGRIALEFLVQPVHARDADERRSG